ncbi:hypothetical protein [Paraflavitalea speifideaquila]|nr:hypothetical protein [Paraflavitalea speifideiaquila]
MKKLIISFCLFVVVYSTNGQLVTVEQSTLEAAIVKQNHCPK